MAQPRFNLLDLDYQQLKDWLKSVGEPTDNAARIFRGIYRDLATTADQIKGIPQSLIQKLHESAVCSSLQPQEKLVSADGQTFKALLSLSDSNTIESALMLYRNPVSGRERRTVCLSSQVGCPIGCAFCLTGKQGFQRNLSSGEILEQVLFFARGLRNDPSENGPEKSQRLITNVVFMGMGEPLANYDNLVKAIAILNSPKGLGLGRRQVTVSTCGLTPQIRRLAVEDIHCELAISLHSVRDEVRNRLVPSNLRYPLSDLKSACRYFFERTSRYPFFEYALFKDLNDSEQDCEDLIVWLGDFTCSINLIRANPVANSDYLPSSMEVAIAFQKRLLEAGFRTMIRASKGADIEAACGQLRSRYLKGA